IGMATVAHGSHLQTAYTLALQTHLTYANLHAYPTHLLTHPILPGLWTKECHLLSVLLSELSNPNPSTRLHWLIWLDADTIIMNPRIPLSTFLPPDDQEAKGFAHDLHMLYTRDWNGLNNGVFFLRVSEWSVEFLSAVLALRSFKPEEELRFTEQSAMEKVMGMGKFEQGVVEVPPFWFNSYVPEGEGGEGETEGDEDKFGYRRGQFLVHFAGKGDKEGEMGKWMDVLRRNRNVLEVEVEETNLGPQVEEFWRSAEEE
ncbi:glycosyltransferase family 34 protein, partial [Cercospora zeae-maydis SCOH1-5]